MHLLIKSCLARGTCKLFEYHCEKVVPSMCMSCLICYLFRQRNERLKEKFPPHRQGIEPTNEGTYDTRGSLQGVGGGGRAEYFHCFREGYPYYI